MLARTSPAADGVRSRRFAQPAETGSAGSPSLVLGDFELRGARVFLRKTGNSAALDRRLLAEVANWLCYQLVLRVVAGLRHLFRRSRPAIWFTPDRPHPRYMVRAAAMWAGVRIARSSHDADAAFFFEDATRSANVARPAGRGFNFGCTDISKTRVARTFEDVFGYPLALDPTSWTGHAVEKSEVNGTHDGRIILCPQPAQPGKTYQRLIDTIAADGCARDLRTHCVDGRVVVVWEKLRAAEDRFLPPNLSVTRHAPERIFSADELQQIGTFARAMGADWCGLDILRDTDSRIYIVDVNKTDAGPIIALSLKEKLASTALLANALLAMIEPVMPPVA